MKKVTMVLLVIFLFGSLGVKAWARDVVDDKRTAVDEAREKDKLAAEKKKIDKWWNIRLSTALQYDDNAVFRPDDDRAVTDDQDQRDWKSISTLSVKLTPLRKERWDGGFRYAFYRSVHAHTEEYELMGNTLSAFLTYKSPKLIIHSQYNFSYFHLENEGYLRLQDVGPTFIWIQSPKFIGIYKPFYRNLNYIDDSLDRDGRDIGISVEEWILFGSKKQFRFSIGYNYTDEDVDDDEYSYKMHEGRLGFNAQIWWGMELDLSMAYQQYDYEDKNSLYNIDRDDKRWVGSMGLSKRFGNKKNMVVELLISRIINNSTIGAEEYHRNVGTLSFAIEW